MTTTTSLKNMLEIMVECRICALCADSDNPDACKKCPKISAGEIKGGTVTEIRESYDTAILLMRQELIRRRAKERGTTP